MPPGRKLALILLFLMAQGFFFYSHLFRLSEVEVRGNHRLPGPDIADRAALAPGTYLWAISPTALARRVEELRGVHSASVQLVIPGRVVITVRERDPVMQVAGSVRPGEWYEIDVEGVILGPVRGATTLPRLRLPGALPTTGRLDPTPVLVALKARSWLEPALPGRIAAYEVDDLQAVSVRTHFLGTPLVVRVGTLQGMNHKMHVLGALLERQKAENRPAAAVDLRFSSPVVLPLKPEPRPSPTP